MISKLWHRLLDFWFEPIVPERLIFWQRIVAFSFLYYTAFWGLHAREWLTSEGFHLSAAATSLAYPSPYPLVPGILLIPFLVLLYGSTILLILNIGGRLTKFVVLAFAIYLQYVDQPASFTLNKMYILSFGMMFFASAPKKVWVQGAAGLVQAIRQSAWPVRVMQATVIIMYCTSGICKSLHGAWLSHSDILYGQVVGMYRTEIATFMIHHMPHWFWVFSSAFALIFELGAPLWFMVRKIRLWGLLAGFIMHLGIAIFLKSLVFFSFQMLTIYLLFLPDRWTLWMETGISRYLRSLGERIRRLFRHKQSSS